MDCVLLGLLAGLAWSGIMLGRGIATLEAESRARVARGNAWAERARTQLARDGGL